MFPYRAIQDLSIEESNAVPKEFYRDRECRHCSLSYKERDNLSQFCCRLHPGILQMNDQHQLSFTCCQRSTHSAGCLSSDHISQEVPLSTTNEEERHAALAGLSTHIIPTDYYRFGIRPPLTQGILFHRRKGVPPPQTPLEYRMPFSPKRKKEFIIDREHTVLRKGYKKHPLLLYYKRSLEKDAIGDRKGRRAKIERGWRGSLWEEAVASDDDEEEEEGDDSTNYKKIDIPFVIIKRFGRASNLIGK